MKLLLVLTSVVAVAMGGLIVPGPVIIEHHEPISIGPAIVETPAVEESIIPVHRLLEMPIVEPLPGATLPIAIPPSEFVVIPPPSIITFPEDIPTEESEPNPPAPAPVAASSSPLVQIIVNVQKAEEVSAPAPVPTPEFIPPEELKPISNRLLEMPIVEPLPGATLPIAPPPSEFVVIPPPSIITFPEDISTEESEPNPPATAPVAASSSPLVQIIVNVQKAEEVAAPAPVPVAPVVLPEPAILPTPVHFVENEEELIMPDPIVMPAPELPEVAPEPILIVAPELPDVESAPVATLPIVPAPAVILPEELN